MPTPASVVNALSIDVEDYYQVQALSPVYSRSDWEGCESRVERNTDLILDILSQNGARATFFTLGWVAKRNPQMLRRIADAGHEVGSHGLCHARVDSQTPEEFRADIRAAKAILEDISGKPVNGYRAATFSVGQKTPWAWPILEEEGHAYSSSIYPVARDNYSNPNAPRTPYKPDGVKSLLEIPIATVRMFNRNWPSGGGGYFRLLPYAVSRAAIAHMNRQGTQAVFYLHPWELDPGQPRVQGLSAKSRFRHYVNLSRTKDRLTRLTRAFRWERIDTAFNVAAQSAQYRHAIGG